jgi:SAM-dependent methyltransferase
VRYKIREVLGNVRFRWQLRLTERRERNLQADVSGIAVPPPRLRYRVHGTLDRERFLKAGEMLANDVRLLVEQVGRPLDTFRHVLDFGCGCGRVLRFLQPHHPDVVFQASDIDQEAIDWSSKHLGELATWQRNEFCPPTSYADGQFDLIYGISVFTHLDEDHQLAWLKELYRIAQPGCILVLSVHGPHCQGDLPVGERENLKAKGLLYRVGRTGWLKRDGLPDAYQTTYHTPEYVDGVWTQFFDLLCYQERGIVNYQDAVVLRKAN